MQSATEIGLPSLSHSQVMEAPLRPTRLTPTAVTAPDAITTTTARTTTAAVLTAVARLPSR